MTEALEYVRPKIRFTVWHNTDGFMLLDHDGNVWREGRKTHIPAFEYHTADHRYGYPRDTREEAMNDMPAPVSMDILPFDAVIANVTFFRLEAGTSNYLMLPSEAERIRQLIEAQTPVISFRVLDGSMRSVNCLNIHYVAYVLDAGGDR